MAFICFRHNNIFFEKELNPSDIAHLRGWPGGRHTQVAEMGAGGEKETEAGSSGTEGRIAMNHEISLHRKIPAISIARHFYLVKDIELDGMYYR